MEHVGSILVRLFGEKFDGYTAEFAKHAEADEALEASVRDDNSGQAVVWVDGRSFVSGQRRKNWRP